MAACAARPLTANHEEQQVMTMQEQERKARRRKLFRWLVIYPAVWIIVSMILFYVTKIS